MSVRFWEPVIEQQIDGTNVTNTTTPSSLLAAAAKHVLAANFYNYIGRKLRIYAAGRVSTAAAGPGTITFDVRHGSTVVFNGGASPTLATSASNLTWYLDVKLTCRVIGAATQLFGVGRLETAALSATTPIMLLPASSPTLGTAFDSIASQLLDLFVTWSVASASNIIRCDDYDMDCN